MLRIKRADGFTRTEVLIIIVLVPMLAFLALPSYKKQERMAARREAKALLTEQIPLLEDYFSKHGSYENAPLSMTKTTHESYVLSFGNALNDGANADAAGFTLQAVPQGVQAGDHCGTLSIDNLGKTLPENCW